MLAWTVVVIARSVCAQPVPLADPDWSGRPLQPDLVSRAAPLFAELAQPPRAPFSLTGYQRNVDYVYPTQSQQRRLFLGGWLAQSLTGNLASPSNRRNAPLSFNDRSNDYLMQQLYMFAHLPVVGDGSQVELGGRVDLLLGSDARFIEMRGWERDRMNRRRWNGDDSLYGVATPQAFVDLALPIGDGVTVRAGRFYALSSFESFMAPANFFVSKSYLYANGSPFGHTGVISSARLGSDWELRLGATQGWDSFNSAASFYGILAGFAFAPQDSAHALTFTVHLGNDWTGINALSRPVDADRHYASLVYQYRLSQAARYVVEYDFGYQEDGKLLIDIPNSMISFRRTLWQGIAQYFLYDIHPRLSSGLRVEWFNDSDHRQLAVPVDYTEGGSAFRGGDFVELTAGLNWYPNANLMVRPEIRYDWSNTRSNPDVPGGVAGLRIFDNRRSDTQWTAACDLVWLF